jgi:hypothetical protein
MTRRGLYRAVIVVCEIAFEFGCATAFPQQDPSAELAISAPQNGGQFAPGHSVTVVVTPYPGVVLSQVIINPEYPLAFTGVLTAPTFQFSITIPSDINPGSYSMTAWAVDSQNLTVVSPGCSWFIARTATLSTKPGR